MDTLQANRLIAGKPWHHNFEVIPGVHVQGSYDPAFLLDMLKLPDRMEGLSVADLGASNGYFSFMLRKRGAKVTAFDFRHKDNSGFGLLQMINGMTDIDHHHINVLDVTPERFGTFDVVLCLGLPYHVADPYKLLANCVALAKQRLLVESYCIDSELPDALRGFPVVRFIADPERLPGNQQPNEDTSNFWGFTSKSLALMVRDLGFAVDRVEVWSNRCLIDARRPKVFVNRVHTAYGVIPHVPVKGDPLDPGAWTIF